MSSFHAVMSRILIRWSNWHLDRVKPDFEHYPEADPFRLMDYCPQGGVKMNKRKMEKWL